jgi:auxin responsive GH3 gene family
MPEAPKTDIPEEHIKALQFIEDVTENADIVQRQVLEQILTQNAPAEYLQRHGLSACTAPNLEAFKKLMPIVSYEDIQSDILRIAHGDISPILSGRPVSEFLTRYT